MKIFHKLCTIGLGTLFLSAMPVLAQADEEAPTNSGGGGGIVGAIGGIICLALVVVMIIGLWKVFTKAGKPGWACLVPIYNVIVLCEIAGRPIWWFILLCIPLVNFVIAIIIALDLAKSFGKEAGFGIGLAFLPFIFYPMLGFSDARYVGPANKPA